MHAVSAFSPGARRSACPEWRLIKSSLNQLLVLSNQIIKPRRGGAGQPRAQALGNERRGRTALQGRNRLPRPFRADFWLHANSQGLRPGLYCWTLSGSKLKSLIKRHSGLSFHQIEPLVVASYIEKHAANAPTVKQHHITTILRSSQGQDPSRCYR